jgi:sarcosine oxidase gamma subunit
VTADPLEFLSPGLARRDGGFEPVQRSPLERGLQAAPPDVRDLSATGKLEVRGELSGLELGGGELVRITPDRALVLCPPEEVERSIERLRAQRCSVVDMTSALAGIQVRGETLLRRLTDLDLGALPAVGAVARVPATVLRHDDEFRIFFPQEYADYVAEVVLDTAAGLA